MTKSKITLTELHFQSIGKIMFGNEGRDLTFSGFDNAQSVLKAISEGEGSVRGIAESVLLSETTVRNTLLGLKEGGYVEGKPLQVTKAGAWLLP